MSLKTRKQTSDSDKHQLNLFRICFLTWNAEIARTVRKVGLLALVGISCGVSGRLDFVFCYYIAWLIITPR